MYDELTANFDEIKMLPEGIMTYTISIGKKKRVEIQLQLQKVEIKEAQS
jgi:hypothetical protein